MSRQLQPTAAPDLSLPPALLWITAVLEVLCPLGFVLIIGHFVDWPTAFGSPPILAVLLILAVSILRLDPRLCLMQGAVAAAGLGVILLTARHADGTHPLPARGIEFHVGQVLLIFLGGALCAYVAHQGRQRLIEIIRTREAEAETQRSLADRTAEVRQAEQTIWQKNELISILSHDLRTPLDGVAGLAELMARSPEQFSPAEIEAYARNIHDTARNLRELLDNLVVWAELRTGAPAAPAEDLPVAATVAPTLRLFEPALAAKSLTLHNHLDPTARVWAHGLGLATVVRNLVSNAIKFTPPHGTITLAVAAADSPAELTMTVTDTGPGLPSDFRIPAAQEEAYSTGRPGLGLRLCTLLLDSFAGRLVLENGPHGGMVARVYLPRKAPAAPPPA